MASKAQDCIERMLIFAFDSTLDTSDFAALDTSDLATLDPSGEVLRSTLHRPSTKAVVA